MGYGTGGESGVWRKIYCRMHESTLEELALDLMAMVWYGESSENYCIRANSATVRNTTLQENQSTYLLLLFHSRPDVLDLAMGIM
jgi:hypothetical protein